MLMILSAYAVVSLSVLTALGLMILKIGTMLGECPESRAAAKSAAVTVATGYCTIGAGGVLLIASVLPVMGNDAALALIAALGLAVLCLGLGFTQAVVQLRAVVNGVEVKAPPEVGLEPVLP